jgi:hypothetical protein
MQRAYSYVYKSYAVHIKVVYLTRLKSYDTFLTYQYAISLQPHHQHFKTHEFVMTREYSNSIDNAVYQHNSMILFTLRFIPVHYRIALTIVLSAPLNILLQLSLTDI